MPFCCTMWSQFPGVPSAFNFWNRSWRTVWIRCAIVRTVSVLEKHETEKRTQILWKFAGIHTAFKLYNECYCTIVSCTKRWVKNATQNVKNSQVTEYGLTSHPTHNRSFLEQQTRLKHYQCQQYQIIHFINRHWPAFSSNKDLWRKMNRSQCWTVAPL